MMTGTNVCARRRYVDIKVTLDFVNGILRFPYLMLQVKQINSVTYSITQGHSRTQKDLTKSQASMFFFLLIEIFQLSIKYFTAETRSCNPQQQNCYNRLMLHLHRKNISGGINYYSILYIAKEFQVQLLGDSGILEIRNTWEEMYIRKIHDRGKIVFNSCFTENIAVPLQKPPEVRNQISVVGFKTSDTASTKARSSSLSILFS